MTNGNIENVHLVILGNLIICEELKAELVTHEQNNINSVIFIWSNGKNGESIVLDKNDIGKFISVTAIYTNDLEEQSVITETTDKKIAAKHYCEPKSLTDKKIIINANNENIVKQKIKQSKKMRISTLIRNRK